MSEQWVQIVQAYYQNERERARQQLETATANAEDARARLHFLDSAAEDQGLRIPGRP